MLSNFKVIAGWSRGLSACQRGSYISAATSWFHMVHHSLMMLKQLLFSFLLIGRLGCSSKTSSLRLTACKQLSDILLSKRTIETEFGDIVKRCRQNLSSSPNYSVSCVGREVNHVTRYSVRMSRCYANQHIFCCISSCIQSIILNKMVWVCWLKKKLCHSAHFN